jgi:hypothetical protein
MNDTREPIRRPGNKTLRFRACQGRTRDDARTREMAREHGSGVQQFDNSASATASTEVMVHRNQREGGEKEMGWASWEGNWVIDFHGRGLLKRDVVEKSPRANHMCDATRAYPEATSLITTVEVSGNTWPVDICWLVSWR